MSLPKGPKAGSIRGWRGLFYRTIRRRLIIVAVLPQKPPTILRVPRQAIGSTTDCGTIYGLLQSLLSFFRWAGWAELGGELIDPILSLLDGDKRTVYYVSRLAGCPLLFERVLWARMN